MPAQLYFFVSIAFAFIAWGIVAHRYIWPKLRELPRAEALRPILVLHSFRFVGLTFVVPGVVSPDLPAAFAHPAAYGDIAAALLALLSLATLQSRAGVAIAWIFNLWGSFDLLSAFYHGGNAGLVPGELGAAYFIPTFLVPLMLITHALAFRILLQRKNSFKLGRHIAGRRNDGQAAHLPGLIGSPDEAVAVADARSRGHRAG